MIVEIQRTLEMLESVDPYERPGLGELYDLGSALPEVISRLRGTVRLGIEPSVADMATAANVADPADAPIHDDTGGHPQDRLRTARIRLQEMDRHLANAVNASRGYHSAIGHLSTRSDAADNEDAP